MTDNELLLAIGDLMDRKLKSELQAELQPIKDEISSIKDEMTSLNSQIDLLKNEQTKTNLIIENEIIPGIQLLKENGRFLFRQFISIGYDTKMAVWAKYCVLSL